LIQSAVLILIAAPTYRYHWRRALQLDAPASGAAS